MKLKVYIENIKETREYESDILLSDVLKDVEDCLPYPVYMAKLDNAYRALTHQLTHDCNLEFLDLRNNEAWLVYQNSLVLVFIKAVHDLFGKDVLVNVRNSLNKGLFITLTHHTLTEEDVAALTAKMNELIAADIPIVKEHATKDQAYNIAKKGRQEETMNLIDSVTNIDDIEIYSLDDETEIFYNLMVPSTGYVRLFEINLYRSGLILSFPHPGNPDKLVEYQEQDMLYAAFSESARWGRLMNVNFVSDLNEKILYDNIDDIILMQEALHEKKISDISDMICERKARLVLICGPSSSGKTTFAKRLCIQLGVNGKKTLYMGTDDYYKELSERVYDENGKPDLESIKAIDTKLFVEHINALLEGKEVDLPHYDFSIPGKVYGKRITKLDKDTIIVIEGIHAMNALLTEGIDDAMKFKIYISPFTPISIDHHNRVSTTDARMLRRIVRDYKFRSSEAQRTIDMWPDVRKSEDVNIFPYNSEADVFFNSNCIYELAVLKKYAEPLLKRIKRDEPEYAEARRMLNFLKYFDSIYDDSMIPNNSIMREFIGGSVLLK
ncbi:MAG: hypothetical protein IJG49_03810 [Erysipelotrichaceae bacterium]|nr:hypothetical protein [Erysipelotrichaceae bacterium]